MSCDLHLHSLASDGSDSPAQLVEKASLLGLSAIALTDHNTVSGLTEFLQAAKTHGIEAIGGVELSTAIGKTEFHLLGLFIPPEHYPKVERVGKEIYVQKEISNMALVERLAEAGYPISYSDVRKKMPDGNANRAHIAAVLVEKGCVPSIDVAMTTILKKGAGFYEPPERYPLLDAIAFLKEIGALPILAHPLKECSASELRSLLPTLMDAGLRGIETHHSDYDEKALGEAAKIAEDFGLLPSGGSDYHGKQKPHISMGSGRGSLSVPDAFYKDLKKAHLA